MKVVVLLAIALSVSQVGVAQKWKEKLNAAKDKVSSGGSAPAVDTTQFKSADTYLADLEQGECPCWDANPAGFPLKSSWPCKLELKEDAKFGQIISVSGTDYYPKLNDDSKVVPYYYSQGGVGRLYLNGNTVVRYSKSQSSDEVILDQLLIAKSNQKGLMAEIAAYERWALAAVEADENAGDADRKAKREAEAAARLAKYGLEGKSVKSIEIKPNVPDVFGHYVSYGYDIIATLADGTKISTADGGYISDYEVTKSSGTYNKFENGFLSSDELVITAKVKSKPSVTATEKIAIPYNQNVQFLLFGRGWHHREGDNGSNTEVYIKQENHSVTGKPVLRVRIKSTAAHAPLSEFSISPNNTIVIDTHGGEGGNDGGSFRGGHGGNITVYKDPSVDNFKLDHNTRGGQGGTSYANDGRDGEYKVITQPVSF